MTDVEKKHRGGRPRDPGVDARVLPAVKALLATAGIPGCTGDGIARSAGVGKASIYRRWPSLDHLLVDVVRELGVRDVDHGPGPGTVRDDLARVLHAATSGDDVAAEVAVLGQLTHSVDLQVAYTAGPVTRLVQAINTAEVRARHRGEREWHDIDPILAAVRMLQHEVLVDGEQPDLQRAYDVVDVVVLPALAAVPA